MKRFLTIIALITCNLLVAQKAYIVTYESKSMNGEFTKLSMQLPPEQRNRMASLDHVVRTFQLTHVDGISTYDFVSARYVPSYTGEQYNANTKTFFYKNIKSPTEAEVIEISNRRGCNHYSYPSSVNYKITDSTKVYGGLLIQKAVGINNPDIIIWFAPSLPIKDGPKSVTGFPGLVIILETKSILTKMVKIEEVDLTSTSLIERPDCPAAQNKN